MTQTHSGHRSGPGSKHCSGVGGKSQGGSWGEGGRGAHTGFELFQGASWEGTGTRRRLWGTWEQTLGLWGMDRQWGFAPVEDGVSAALFWPSAAPKSQLIPGDNSSHTALLQRGSPRGYASVSPPPAATAATQRNPTVKIVQRLGGCCSTRMEPQREFPRPGSTLQQKPEESNRATLGRCQPCGGGNAAGRLRAVQCNAM